MECLFDGNVCDSVTDDECEVATRKMTNAHRPGRVARVAGLTRNPHKRAASSTPESSPGGQQGTTFAFQVRGPGGCALDAVYNPLTEKTHVAANETLDQLLDAALAGLGGSIEMDMGGLTLSEDTSETPEQLLDRLSGALDAIDDKVDELRGESVRRAFVECEQLASLALQDLAGLEHDGTFAGTHERVGLSDDADFPAPRVNLDRFVATMPDSERQALENICRVNQGESLAEADHQW